MEMLMLLERNLSAKEASEIKRHIEKCEECFFIYDTDIKIRNSKIEDSYPALADEDKIRATNILKSVIKQKKNEKLNEKAPPENTIWPRLMHALFPAERQALAASDSQTADQKQMKAASSGEYSFVAICDRKDSGFWRATIRLPSAPTPETELRLKLTGYDGQPIRQGTMIFCGIKKNVTNGRCYIPLSELKRHKNQHAIILRLPSGKEVEGVQELFPDKH
jgi:hypothetical protein